MSDSSEAAPKIPKQSTEDGHQLAAWLIEEKWQLVHDGASPHPLPSGAAILKPIPRSASQLDVFNTYLPPALWDTLSVVANRNLARRNPSDTWYRTTTPVEMRRWYSIQIGLENTWGNSSTNLREHFAEVKCMLHSTGMGYDRFCVLSICCCPTASEHC